MVCRARTGQGRAAGRDHVFVLKGEPGAYPDDCTPALPDWSNPGHALTAFFSPVLQGEPGAHPDDARHRRAVGQGVPPSIPWAGVSRRSPPTGVPRS